MNANPLKRWAAPLTGILSLVVVTASHAVFVAPGGGPVVLDGTANFGGNLLADQTVAFLEPNSFFEGTLRSVVVESGSGTLDFYFQLTNTTTPDPGFDDVFRLVLTGFNGFGTGAGDLLEVNYVTNGLSGITSSVVGTKPAFSGDRLPDVLADQVGFDFGPTGFLGDPGNVLPGEVSQFMVIRTNARLYELVNNEIISGLGTAFASGFAPAVPEPATLLAGLVLGSFVAYRDLGRGRRRSPVSKS